MLLSVENKLSNIVKQLNLIRLTGAKALPNYHTGPSDKYVTIQNTYKLSPYASMSKEK